MIDRIPARCNVLDRSATTSQPRSLLSIARLNIAKSRVRPATCNRVRIDQTCFGRSGSFWPISLPLFQRQDFTVGLSVTEAGVDDPDQQFYENYVCGAERNYTGYCSPEVDKLIDQQSMEPDQDKRKKWSGKLKDAWPRMVPGR